MPPAISDAESASDDVPDMIPARTKSKADPEPAEEEVEAEEEEEEEEEEEGDGADEYRVEKILKHDHVNGVLLYQIKWLGYEDEKDMTWEPEENLDGAKNILAAYHKKIGGPPQPPAKSGKKKGRASAGGKRSASDAFADSPVPAAAAKKKGRESNGVVDEPAPKRTLPPGSWDNEVVRVVSVVEETAQGEKGRGKDEKELLGLLQWKDDNAKTQHKMKVLRQKVPQRLLDYYEQHLVFTHADETADGAKAEDTKMEDAKVEDTEE